jgi:RimJ/RimL family protein N-acetyltransferase
MPFDLQPTLENESVKICPLKEDDFEELYKVASDPLIWEQHPTKTRYQKEVFQNYFKGAIESGGAFAVYDNKTGDMTGCTRFYDYDETAKSVLIGYTFIARHCWGSNYNRSMKSLMLDHAFHFVDKVIFHVGVMNMRSRKAMEKLGARLVGNAEKVYYGESVNPNCIYEMEKSRWSELRKSITV